MSQEITNADEVKGSIKVLNERMLSLKFHFKYVIKYAKEQLHTIIVNRIKILLN